jgi:DNA-binding NarL/FixJ family response regulator
VIRVFLAASSPILLAGLERVVTESGEATIVGRSTHVASLAAELRGVDADVLVVTLDEGMELRGLAGVDPDAAHRMPPAVVLADLPNAQRALALFQDGVRSVLPLHVDPRELLAAIEAVAAGLVAMPAELATLTIRPAARRVRAGDRPSPVTLSPRESEILGLLAEGMPNKIIASRLGISEHTVKTHVASLLEKLGAETRAEAVAIGARQGLILL